MGYRLNPSLTTLMSHVRASSSARYQETIGWINVTHHADFFVNKTLPNAAYSQLLMEGARQRANQLGFELDVCWQRAPAMTGRRLSAILAARGIRGILIPPLPRACGHLSLDWSEFAVTTLSYTMSRPLFHRVVPDHHYNMQLILRTLRHRGYKRIGVLVIPRHNERADNRILSVYYARQLNLPARDRIPVLLCNNTGFEADSAAWLNKHRPDAVITLGSYRHLREIAIGDPAYSEKLGVVLLGYAPTDAGFAAVDENPRRIGAAAVDHLSGQLNRNERGIPDSPETVLIKGTWVEGQSLFKERTH
jgi:LacI family transcriptional regulator